MMVVVATVLKPSAAAEEGAACRWASVRPSRRVQT
jgi:hypothetical protein